MIIVYMVEPKKLVLFPYIGRVKIFLSLTTSIVECVSEYIFNFKKQQTNKQTNKQKNQESKKAKKN